MSSRSLSRSRVLLVSIVLTVAAAAGAATAVLTPSKDTSIYSESLNSSGAGVGLYAGRAGATSGGSTRRALVAFNLTGIPSGSTINSVTLKLYCIRTVVAAQTVGLHRLTADWGEGTSVGSGSGAPATTNDATWDDRFFPATDWTTDGGDFAAAASASQSVDVQGALYTWGSNAQMISDVQGWVNTPATNFGWLIKGNEATFPTTKEFNSKEVGPPVSGPDLRPTLTVDYTPASGIDDWAIYGE